jgi:hypothetical protein
MTSITVNGIPEVQQLLDRLKRETPTMARYAINDAMVQVKEKEREETGKVFDRVTPFIQNSLRVDYLKNIDSTGRVWFKDVYETLQFDPVTDVLTHHIKGGNRKAKLSEQRLRRAGIISRDEWLIPVGAPLNQYGNVTGAYMVKVLASLQAFTESGGARNALGSKIRWMVGEAGGTRGIYEIQGGVSNADRGRWKLIFLITKKAPRYRAVFDFTGIGQKEFDRVLPLQIEAKWRRYIAQR